MMLMCLSLLAMLLVAVAMGLSLAHALEFPGKIRLDQQTYRAVQAIYYPGFTIGGLIGEFGGMLTLSALLLLIPNGTQRFWWTVVALVLMLAGHLIYWVVTHPVNAAWLEGTHLGGPSRFFFGLLSAPDAQWTHMRNVWEWSHVARAVVGIAAFLCLTVSMIF